MYHKLKSMLAAIERRNKVPVTFKDFQFSQDIYLIMSGSSEIGFIQQKERSFWEREIIVAVHGNFWESMTFDITNFMTLDKLLVYVRGILLEHGFILQNNVGAKAIWEKWDNPEVLILDCHKSKDWGLFYTVRVLQGRFEGCKFPIGHNQLRFLTEEYVT